MGTELLGERSFETLHGEGVWVMLGPGQLGTQRYGDRGGPALWLLQSGDVEALAPRRFGAVVPGRAAGEGVQVAQQGLSAAP